MAILAIWAPQPLRAAKLLAFVSAAPRRALRVRIARAIMSFTSVQKGAPNGSRPAQR